MDKKEFRSNMIAATLLLFLAAWTYTEIVERFERLDFMSDVRSELDQFHEFMNRGDRFTSDEGRELERRIDKLERPDVPRDDDDETGP